MGKATRDRARARKGAAKKHGPAAVSPERFQHRSNVPTKVRSTSRGRIVVFGLILAAVTIFAYGPAWTQFVDERERRPWRFYRLALVFYVLALSAKSTACTLPAALFLILWLQKKRIDWTRVWQIAPFVVLGVTMGLIAMWWERYHMGTRGTMFALGPLERLIVATHAAWFYLGKLFWPTKLTFIYPQWTITPGNPLAYIWLVAGIALCAAIYFARR